jgi:hypothetical protein
LTVDGSGTGGKVQRIRDLILGDAPPETWRVQIHFEGKLKHADSPTKALAVASKSSDVGPPLLSLRPRPRQSRAPSRAVAKGSTRAFPSAGLAYGAMTALPVISSRRDPRAFTL